MTITCVTVLFESNCAKLVGCNVNQIIESVNLLLNDSDFYNSMSNVTNPYGDGKASERILEKSIDYLKKKS